MRTWVAVALCAWVGLWASTATADTFYKYRDQASGREVFVNRLDQVPHKYRAQARIVLEGPDTANPPASAPPAEHIEVQPDTHRPILRTVTPTAPGAEQLRRALLDGDPLHAMPRAAGLLLDAKLAEKGAPPLYANERASLSELLVAVVIASLLAALAALVAWIVILVTAIRDGRIWWAVFIFLFWPLGYVYVFLHGGKGRALWKTLCTLGMLAPALVGLVGAWRFYAWFSTMIQARGGRL